MPLLPLRVCVTCGKAGCSEHVRPPWRTAHQIPRLRGRQLQAARRRLFQEHPFCVECVKQDIISVATIRDHIVPLAEGGRDDDTNVQPLCQQCSDLKTAEEAKRGIRRRSA